VNIDLNVEEQEAEFETEKLIYRCPTCQENLSDISENENNIITCKCGKAYWRSE
jgi:uncharacterized protein with PIN domain